jgi:hypothetical protein
LALGGIWIKAIKKIFIVLILGMLVAAGAAQEAAQEGAERYEQPHDGSSIDDGQPHDGGSNEGGQPHDGSSIDDGQPHDSGSNDGGQPHDGGSNDGGQPHDGGSNDGGHPHDGGSNDGGHPHDGGSNDGGHPNDGCHNGDCYYYYSGWYNYPYTYPSYYYYSYPVVVQILIKVQYTTDGYVWKAAPFANVYDNNKFIGTTDINGCLYYTYSYYTSSQPSCHNYAASTTVSGMNYYGVINQKCDNSATVIYLRPSPY